MAAKKSKAAAKPARSHRERADLKLRRQVQQYEYDHLREHIGHSIVCVCYGRDGEDPYNVAIECEDCSVVITSQNHPDVDA